MFSLRNKKNYSRLSLSRTARDSLKYIEREVRQRYCFFDCGIGIVVTFVELSGLVLLCDNRLSVTGILIALHRVLA